MYFSQRVHMQTPCPHMWHAFFQNKTSSTQPIEYVSGNSIRRLGAYASYTQKTYF
jgi:hypothetical protein